MPAVFVHGVPDTAALWQPLMSNLRRRDTITLRLPGFGNKRPAGFTPEMNSYASWIADQIARIDEPVDLVGHDWGALLCTRVVTLKPNSVRSWSVGAAPLHPDYVWHDTAKTWQTPTKGEEFMKLFGGEPVVQALIGQGQPEALARETVSHIDDEMKDCILTLYRSAVNAGRDWYPDVKRIDAPGLITWGEKDPFADVKFGEWLARDTGARFHLMKGCGHWYPAQDPVALAGALEEHWARAGA